MKIIYWVYLLLLNMLNMIKYNSIYNYSNKRKEKKRKQKKRKENKRKEKKRKQNKLQISLPVADILT